MTYERWDRRAAGQWPLYEPKSQSMDETVVMQQVRAHREPLTIPQLTEAVRQVKELKTELDNAIQTEQKYSDRTLMALACSVLAALVNLCILVSMIFLRS